MITEIYVPRAALASFMRRRARRLPRDARRLIYGTIRLIERDDETRPGLGARAVGLRHLQPARRAHA